MKSRDYLLDRLPLLGAFAVAVAFLIVVAQLAGGSMRAGDIAYVLLLALVFAVVILGIDYWRQRAFWRGVERELEAAANSPGRPMLLPRPVTREQGALLRLLEERQQASDSELARLRATSREHRVFIDHWVHQMKTPLSIIELTAQRALHSAEPAQVGAGDQAEWESVEEEAQRLTDGFDMVLANARLEEFALDLRPAKVDVGELCRGVVNELKRSWIRAEVYPALKLPELPVYVETDRKWFEVVLRQLLSNAIKYTVAGGGDEPLEVGADGPTTGAPEPLSTAGSAPERSTGGSARTVTIRVEQDHDDVLLSVEDNGIGIPEHDLPRIFDRFFTGENGRLTKASTGVGLYLVAQICRRLGHRVEVRSAAGAGTTVAVRFSSRTLHGGLSTTGSRRK